MSVSSSSPSSPASAAAEAAGRAQADRPQASGSQPIVARLRAAGCVFAEDEARLLISAAPTPADLAVMVDRRAAGVPLEHVLGWAEFCGLRIVVDPGVFVPRPRTEFLVRQAVALARHNPARHNPARQAGFRRIPERPVVVVDLCCGSGAVGAAIAATLGREEVDVELHAADIDSAAVRCARSNVAAARGRVYEGDLDSPLPAALRARVDVMVANAPYVPTHEVTLLPREARVHEPRTALDGGTDGLDVLRRVAEAAPGWLAPGGHLLVETSERQAPHLADVLAGNGLRPRVIGPDEWDATVVIGAKPADT